MKRETKRKLISVIFPERCPYCRDAVRPCEIACEDCKEILPEYAYTKKVAGDNTVLAAVPYKDSFKDAILRIKFGRKKQYAYQLAKMMSERLSSELKEPDFDVITFVPLHPKTLKERGFNQSELLARYIGENLQIPCEALLKKTRLNEPQHKILGSNKRKENVKGVFRCIDKKRVKGRKILLIDDIVTTGFTLSECVKMLSEYGCDKIYCMTFAITLPKTT